MCACGSTRCRGYLEADFPMARPPQSTRRAPTTAAANPLASHCTLTQSGAGPGEAAPTTLELINKNVTFVYCDGSGSTGPAPRAGWAAVFYEHLALAPISSDRELGALYGPVWRQQWKDSLPGIAHKKLCPFWMHALSNTSNSGEISGVAEGLHHYHHHLRHAIHVRRADNQRPILIFMLDSFLTIRALTSTDKLDAQLQPLKEWTLKLLDTVETHTTVYFIHVRGHSNVTGNIRADALAEQGKRGDFSAIGRFQEFALNLATFQRSHQEETDSLFGDNSPRDEDNINIEMNHQELNSLEDQGSRDIIQDINQDNDQAAYTSSSSPQNNININATNRDPNQDNITRERKTKRKKRDFNDQEDSKDRQRNNQDINPNNNQENVYSLDFVE